MNNTGFTQEQWVLLQTMLIWANYGGYLPGGTDELATVDEYKIVKRIANGFRTTTVSNSDKDKLNEIREKYKKYLRMDCERFAEENVQLDEFSMKYAMKYNNTYWFDIKYK